MNIDYNAIVMKMPLKNKKGFMFSYTRNVYRIMTEGRFGVITVMSGCFVFVRERYIAFLLSVSETKK